SHDHEVWVHGVRANGRLARDVQALFDELSRHRSAEVETLAHRPGGRQDLVNSERRGRRADITGNSCHEQVPRLFKPRAESSPGPPAPAHNTPGPPGAQARAPLAVQLG